MATYSKEIDGVEFQVHGILDGDIKWNLADVRIKWGAFECQIRPFTNNCGIKTIENIYNGTPRFLEIVESFLWWKCNCGIVIGSDCKLNDNSAMGGTIRALLSSKTPYQMTDPIWNPNYTWDHNHTIVLFWKNLNEITHFDFWGDVEAEEITFDDYDEESDWDDSN